MEPAYFEGDRVLTFNWGNLRKGDVVVFVNRNVNLSFWGVLRLRSGRLQNPVSKRFWMHSLWSFTRMTNQDRIMYFIKRIDKIQSEKVIVSGDNKKMTSKIGPIYKNQIVGKVIWKY